MHTQRTRFLVGECVLLLALLGGKVQAQNENSPFVVRTFAFFSDSSDLAPDFFKSEKSLHVTVLKEYTAADFSLAPCEEFGELAGTRWLVNAARHATIGRQAEVGQFFWLVSEENPELPPIGATTLTGPDSPMVLSQQVFKVANWTYLSDCEGGKSGDLIVATYGHDLVVVTAVFFR